ncbi:hypothetical protein GXM_03968 [Nostoc sphaeroides CCNUC1]|uniref:Uncharacterized protein n=1 Tax=Nostoc sphaeroides CCNUC1 TaxID=2653204 RepID=A0A5P8W177_9NOSO|nr:hypothetical protein GXM_03968 [Nostoc sphaeroides CCNUC1]
MAQYPILVELIILALLNACSTFITANIADIKLNKILILYSLKQL